MTNSLLEISYYKAWVMLCHYIAWNPSMDPCLGVRKKSCWCMDALYLVPRELSDFLFHAHSLSHSNTATLPSLVLLNTPSTPPSGLLALSLSFPWILFSKLSTQLTLLPFSDLDSNDTLLIRYSLISRSKMQLLTFLALVSALLLSLAFINI